jgi:Ig-like domain-containing protein
MMSQPAEPSRLSRRTFSRFSSGLVVLSLRANGEHVLPTVYSDNYLWLLPAESRDIDIDRATADLGGHSPTIQVTACGATLTTVSA